MIINGPTVPVGWLFENSNNPKVVILDASLQKPAAKTEGLAAHLKIPNSIFFDIENVFSDKASSLPHTMPAAAAFTKEAQLLGINSNSIIVVYDAIGVYSAPRAWWMFKAMGHDAVFVLNGGLPEWEKAGYPTVTDYKYPIEKGNFIGNFQPFLMASQQEVIAALNDNTQKIIDARSPERFAGKVAEPRAGLRLGHIPHAVNIYFEQVLQNNLLQDKSALEKIFEAVADKEEQLIFSCGSGVTACITALAATVAGYNNIRVYDGSWSEWGLPSDVPVE